MCQAREAFSAALCRGLIEAYILANTVLVGLMGFPRLYAAASLKLAQAAAYRERFEVFRGFMPRPH